MSRVLILEPKCPLTMEFMILKWEPWIEIIFVKHVAVIIATVLGILLILIWHNLFIIPVMSHISIKS
jgi:hypothetical protein